MSIKSELSKKFLILSSNRNSKIEDVDKQIRYPYLCCKCSKFRDVPAIKIKSMKGYPKKTFSFSPVIEEVKIVKRFTKKEEMVAPKVKKASATIYIPMKRVDEARIRFDQNYKSLIDGLNLGLYLKFMHEVFDENVKNYENLSLEDMPEELLEEVERRENMFVDSFDAFEIEDDDLPMIATIEELGDVEYAIYTANFYRFNQMSPSYEHDIAGIKNAVNREAYMNR